MNTLTAQRAEARLGLLWVMAAATLWGTVGVITKTLYGLADTNPISIAFFRVALSVPVLLMAGWHTLGPKLFRIAPRDFGLMALIGLMTAFPYVCYFTAIEYVGVSIATLVAICTAPVIVAVLSIFITREPLTKRVLVALLCALVGTGLLVQIQPDSTSLTNGITGVLWALGAALGFAIVTLIGRNLVGRYHPLQPVAIGFSIGAIALFLVAWPSGLAVNYPLTGWGLLAYLGCVPTALGYGLYLRGAADARDGGQHFGVAGTVYGHFAGMVVLW